MMFVVFRAVREIEEGAARYSFARFRSQQSNNNDSNDDHRRSRRIMVQGILYSLILFVVHLFKFISIFYEIIYQTKPDTDTLMILSYTFLPAQGFFNALVYLIPFFQRLLGRQRGDNRRGSIWMTGERIVRVRQNIRMSLANSFMVMKRNDADKENNHLSQNDDNIMEEEHMKKEKRAVIDIKFPVTGQPPQSNETEQVWNFNQETKNEKNVHGEYQ